MTRGRALSALGALLALLSARSALAEGTDDLESLLSENVITTASTTAQTASTAPATSVTITAEELRTYGIRSLDEAINFLSLGVVTSDTLGAPDIGSRGVLTPHDDGKHVLLLVNGHALNDPLYGSARFDQGAGVPFDMIDHIEVIVGPGSVLYGSDAMLGVINVITRSGADYKGVHVVAEVEPGRSERAGASAGTTFKLFGEPSELTVGVEMFNRFGPDLDFATRTYAPTQVSPLPPTFRRGSNNDGIWGGTVRDAYFTQAPTALLRLRSGSFDVSLMASSTKRGIPVNGPGESVDFDDAGSVEEERAIRLDIAHQAALSSLVGLSSRLYADSFDRQRRLNRDAASECLQSTFQTCQYYDAGLARWGGIEERLSFNWSGDFSLVTLLGVDARMRWVSAKEDPIDLGTGRLFAPSTGYVHDSAGIVSPYVQQSWSPARWLDLNAGARLDADARFSPIVSPRGAIAWTPFRKTTFKAIYSQAFRAPTWFETDVSNAHQARAPDLVPEKVRSVEASIEQKFGTHRLLFGVFRTWWDDLSEPRLLSFTELGDLRSAGQVPLLTTSAIQHRNVATLDNYGWNGRWTGTLAEGRFSYGLDATAAFTHRSSAAAASTCTLQASCRLADDGGQLTVAPQVFGNVHLAYAFGGAIPTPAIAISYVGQRPADRAFTEAWAAPASAPPLAEIRGTLSGQVPGLRGLGYRLSAAYATAAEGPYIANPGPGPYDVGMAPVLVPIDRFRAFIGLRYDGLGDTGVTQ